MNTDRSSLHTVISNIHFENIVFRKFDQSITKAIQNNYTRESSDPIIPVDQLRETREMKPQDWIDYFQALSLFSDKPHLDAANYLINQWISTDPFKAYTLFFCLVWQTDIPRVGLLTHFLELQALHSNPDIDLNNKILTTLLEEIPNILVLLPYYTKLRDMLLEGALTSEYQKLNEFFISHFSEKPESLSQKDLEKHFEFLLNQAIALKQLPLLSTLLNNPYLNEWLNQNREKGLKLITEALTLILTKKQEYSEIFSGKILALVEQIANELFFENNPLFSSWCTSLKDCQISTHKMKILESLHDLKTSLQGNDFNKVCSTLKKVIEHPFDNVLETSLFDLITQFYNLKKNAALNSLKTSLSRAKNPHFQEIISKYLISLCNSKDPYSHLEKILEISKETKIATQELLHLIDNLIKAMRQTDVKHFEALQKMGLDYLRENSFSLSKSEMNPNALESNPSEGSNEAQELLYSLKACMKNKDYNKVHGYLKKIIETPIAPELEASLFELINQFYSQRRKAALDCFMTNSNRTKNLSFQKNVTHYLASLCNAPDSYLHLEKYLDISSVAQIFDPKLTDKIITLITTPRKPSKQLKKEDIDALQKKGLRYVLENFNVINKNHVVPLIDLALAHRKVNLLACLIDAHASDYVGSLRDLYPHDYTKQVEELLRQSFPLLNRWSGEEDLLRGIICLIEAIPIRRRSSFSIPFIKLCLGLNRVSYYSSCLNLLHDEVSAGKYDRKTIHELQQKVYKNIGTITNSDINKYALLQLQKALMRTSDTLLTKWQGTPRIEIMPIIETFLHVVEVCKAKGLKYAGMLNKSGEYLKELAEKASTSNRFNPFTAIKVVNKLIFSNDYTCIDTAEQCVAYEKIKESFHDSLEKDWVERFIYLRKLEILLGQNPFITPENHLKLEQTLKNLIKNIHLLTNSPLAGMSFYELFADKHVDDLWKAAITCANIFMIIKKDANLLITLKTELCKINIHAVKKLSFDIGCDRLVIGTTAANRTALSLDRKSQIQSQCLKMTKLVSEAIKELENLDVEDCQHLRSSFVIACGHFLFSISPLDPSEGSTHVIKGLAFIEKAWEQKLITNENCYNLFKTYLTAQIPQTSLAHIAEGLCIQYGSSPDPFISTYFLYLITSLQSHLTFNHVIKLAGKIHPVPELLEFTAISQLLIRINTTTGIQDKKLNSFEKEHLYKLAKSFTLKIKDKSSLELFSIWTALIQTLVELQIFNSSQEFFKLIRDGACASILVINKLSDEHKTIHPSLLIYSLIEKCPAKTMKCFIKRREEFIEDWLNTLKRDDLLEREYFVAPLLKALNSSYAMQFFSSFKNIPKLEAAQKSLSCNLNSIYHWSVFDLGPALRDFPQGNQNIFPKEEQTLPFCPSINEAKTFSTVEQKLQEMLGQPEVDTHDVAKLLVDHMSQFTPHEISRLLITCSLKTPKNFSEICSLCFNYLKQDPIINLEKIFILLGLNQNPDLNQWLQTINFVEKADEPLLWDKLLQVIEKKNSLDFLLNEQTDPSIFSLIFPQAIFRKRILLLKKILINYQNEILGSKTPTALLEQAITTFVSCEHPPTKSLLSSLHQLIIYSSPLRFDLSLVSSFVNYCVQSKALAYYSICLDFIDEIMKYPLTSTSKAYEKTQQPLELIEKIFRSLTKTNLSNSSQLSLERITRSMRTIIFRPALKTKINMVLKLEVMIKMHNALNVQSYVDRPFLLESICTILFEALAKNSSKSEEESVIDQNIMINIMTALLETTHEEYWDKAKRIFDHFKGFNLFSTTQVVEYIREYYIAKLERSTRNLTTDREPQLPLPSTVEARLLFKGKIDDMHMQDLILSCMAAFSIQTALDLEDKNTTQLYEDLFASIEGLSEKQIQTMRIQADRTAFHRLVNHPKRSVFYNKCYKKMLQATEYFEQSFFTNESHENFKNAFTNFVFFMHPRDPDLGQQHTENCMNLIKKGIEFKLLFENTHTQMLKFFLDPASMISPKKDILTHLVNRGPATTFYQGNTTHVLYLLSRNPSELDVNLMVKFIFDNQFSFTLIDFVAASHLLCSLSTPFKKQDSELWHQVLLLFSILFIEKIFESKTDQTLQFLSTWFALMNKYLEWDMYKGHSTKYVKLIQTAIKLYFNQNSLKISEKESDSKRSLISEIEFFSLTYLLLEKTDEVCDSNKYLKQRDKTLKNWFCTIDGEASKKCKKTAIQAFKQLIERSEAATLPKLQDQLSKHDWDTSMSEEVLANFDEHYFYELIDYHFCDKLLQLNPHNGMKNS